jgi:tetratricopeptide (TPR) repeat protein
MRISRLCLASALRGQRKRNTLALCAAAWLICGPLYAQPDTVARDAALASALLPGAMEAYSLGFKAEAIELVEEALAFVPSHSDANYLRALYGLSTGEPLAGALSNLERALAGSSFNRVAEDDARLLYASLLVRTHRSSTALRMLEGIQGSAESLFIESVARRTLGDQDGARKAIIRSLEQYPHDPRPLLAWLRSAERPIQDARDKKVISAGFLALETLKISDPDVLVELAPYAVSVDETRYLIREFRATGGASARASILALKFGLATEAKAISEFFSGVYVFTQADMDALYRMLSSESSRSEFAAAFAGFSGIVLDDPDKDGIAETAISLTKGALVSWKHDPDQDGLVDAEIEFGSALPLVFKTTSGSTRLTLRYDPWPKVSEAVFIDGTGTRRYRLGPARVSFPVVSLIPIGADPLKGPYLINVSGEGMPSERLFVTSAYKLERTRESIRETVELHEGIPQRAWWYDDLGRTGYSVYSRGVPAPESIDLDGDGRFESRRLWAITELGNVVPEYIETDLDADGLYEYREMLVAPFVKSWDYDADGAVDLTLETLPDNKHKYLFFGNNGVAGVIVVLTVNGVIENVSEGGAPLPLNGDAGGKVIWVGRKPFDFGKRIPLPGYGVQDGIAYRVVVIGSTLYARIFQ